MPNKPKKTDKVKIYVDLDRDVADLADYWQRKKNFASRKDFITAAIKLYIAIQNQDYDLPTMEIARINQIVETLRNQTDELHALRKAVNNGFSTILDLTNEDDTDDLE